MGLPELVQLRFGAYWPFGAALNPASVLETYRDSGRCTRNPGFAFPVE